MARVAVKAFNQNTILRALMADDDTDTTRHVSNPLEDAVYVYTPIAAIMRSVSRVQLRVVNKATKKTVPDHDDSWKLLEQPNAMEKRRSFLQRTVMLRYRDGEVFWIKPDIAARSMLPAVHIATKREMKPATTNGLLVGWDWTPRGTASTKRLELDQVCRLYFPHPDDVLKSMSPFTSAQVAMDEYVFAGRYGAAVFQNGAHLGVCLGTDKYVDPVKRKEMLRDLRAGWGSYINGGKPMIFWDGMKPFAPPQTLKDLDMTALKAITRDEQVAPSLTPPMFSGIYDNATFNNTRQQEQFFWDMTGIAEVEFVVDCWNGFVQSPLNDLHEVEPIFTSVQALKERDVKNVDAILALQKHGIPINVLIDVYDLPIPKQPWGDEPLVSPGLVPISLVFADAANLLATESEPEGAPQESEDSDADGENENASRAMSQFRRSAKAMADELEKADSAARRRRIHKKWKASYAELSRQAAHQYKRFLKRQGDEVISRLKKAGLPTKANTKAATTKAELEQWLKRIVFDLKTENRKLELLSSVIFRESAELGGEQAAREAEAPEDFTFNIESPAMKRRLTTQAIKVRKVNRTTQEAIRTVLQRGVNQGRSLAEISEALGDMLGRRAGHGFRIAQTEVHEAISAGRHEGFNQAGIKARRWLSSGLNTVRPSHRDIEAATLRTPVPAGEKFQLIDPEDGSVAEAEYPGDGKLPADERISCSCMLVAAETVSGKQLSDQHYDAVRFVAWRPMHPRKNKKAA